MYNKKQRNKIGKKKRKLIKEINVMPLKKKEINVTRTVTNVAFYYSP